MIARKYAQIVGPVLILVGIVGLIFGEAPLLGVLNINIQEDVIHLLSGGLLAFMGFTKGEQATARAVGLLGAIYLLVGVIGFVSPKLLGILHDDYSLLDNLIHLFLGVAGLAVSWVSLSKKGTRPDSSVVS